MNRSFLVGAKAIQRVTCGVKAVRPSNFCFQARSISESSWAADILKGKGENLTPSTQEDVIVTDDILNKPSPKIKELGEKFLELNAIEAAQLLRVIQVIAV